MRAPASTALVALDGSESRVGGADHVVTPGRFRAGALEVVVIIVWNFVLGSDLHGVGDFWLHRQRSNRNDGLGAG